MRVTLKMHDLKMTEKENYGSGKCRSTSLVEFNLPIQCTSKKLYAIHFKVAQARAVRCVVHLVTWLCVCIFDVYLANYRKTLFELD